MTTDNIPEPLPPSMAFVSSRVLAGLVMPLESAIRDRPQGGITGHQEMLVSAVFTPTERERMAVLINNLCFYASQLVIHSSAEISQRALLNLDKIKNECEPLLKRLDEVAREQGDHSPLRVIEDLVHRPNDVAQMLMLVRRCLLASGFLGHCLAQPIHAVSAEAPSPEKRLH
jgi:hypothetical protein